MTIPEKASMENRSGRQTGFACTGKALKEASTELMLAAGDKR
jgi:hypothetical protein